MLAGLLLPVIAQSDQSPRIAVASSLQFVIPEIATKFKQNTGHSLRITYGSSGNFRRQIIQGAPFELFLSANESYVDALVERELTLDTGRVYALGRLAAIVPNNSAIDLTEDLSGLRIAIEKGELSRFAIANPDHAPYGRAARETLETLGLWHLIQPFIIRGENASQATQFAVSGSSQGGIVPYALAISPIISASNRVMPLPQSSHRPIQQKLVLLKGASQIARQFYDFITSSDAQDIFTRFGYEVIALNES
jgi:molybdate transport system substrate-binding protein